MRNDFSCRYTSDDVITIWEACWLTDNTYQYDDVVKMMADIIISLRGNVRVGNEHSRMIACKARFGSGI